MPATPIQSPAAYVPAHAAAYADTDGTAINVSVAKPLPVAINNLPSTQTVSGTVAVTNLPATQAISAAALPLPAGAASDASVQAIRTALGSPLQAGGAVSISNLPANQTVSIAFPPATALAGTAAASAVVGPFQPVLGRAVVLTLSGTWTGLVKVTRSTDGGATRQPLTAGGISWAQFSANACEAVWDESDATARLYLDITLTTGTLTYRMAQ